MPLETQFYIGFYNKSLFKKAGITSVPTDWTQLFADCEALKAMGIQPMVYGNGGQAISTEFYPWYDMSYLMIGAHSLASWKGLYDGTIPWTSSANVDQLKKWATLEKDGYTNSDVLTNTANIQQFEKGKAAMMVDGTWDTAQYTSTMGTNVAAFVPPYSNTPIKGVVEYPGDGFSVMKYSKNKADAFKFFDFLDDDPSRQHHQQGRAHPRHQGSHDNEPGEPGDVELRHEGPPDAVPDDGQLRPGERRQRGRQGLARGARQPAVGQIGASRTWPRSGTSCPRPSEARRTSPVSTCTASPPVSTLEAGGDVRNLMDERVNQRAP